jgi:hypothetical protein
MEVVDLTPSAISTVILSRRSRRKIRYICNRDEKAA